MLRFRALLFLNKYFFFFYLDNYLFKDLLKLKLENKQ